MLLLLVFKLSSLEPAKCAHALVEMWVANCRGNLSAWQAKAVGTPSAFGFDQPKRKLRKPLFDIGETDSRKIETHGTLRFSCKLFCHERLPTRHGFPIDVTLRLARHVGAYSGKVIAFAKVRLWPAMWRTRATQRELRVSGRLGIHNVPLGGRKLFYDADKTERINTRHAQCSYFMFAALSRGKSKRNTRGFACWDPIYTFAFLA
jgi:hypothetical protein